MPALPVPACGFTVGSKPKLITGLKLKVSQSGLLKGWKTMPTAKDEFTLIFSTCTNAERAALKAFYVANLITGGVTFTFADGVAYTVQFLEDGYDEQPTQSVYWTVTLRCRES